MNGSKEGKQAHDLETDAGDLEDKASVWERGCEN